MMQKLKAFLRDDDGASAIEYGLIVGLIAVALVVVLMAVAGPQGLKGLFTTVQEKVSEANSSGSQ